jgi:hypothetical protein
MNGWIKLYRKFCEWEWFNISEMVHLFIYLLINANHETGNWRGIEIKRGQILTGLNSLHEKTKISIQTLRTCLKRLEETKEINTQITNKYRIITICNYESYQGIENDTNKQPNKQLTSNQQATNKQLTTNKKNKEEKELKNDKKFIIPKIEEIKNYCQERNNNVNSDKFFNFYESKGWMVGKNKMKDWKAAIRTWENPKEFKKEAIPIIETLEEGIARRQKMVIKFN